MLENRRTYNSVWQGCLDLIKSQIAEVDFVRWFKAIRAHELDGTALRLAVPDKSYVMEIEGRFISILRPIVAKMYGDNVRILYVVPKAEAASTSNTPSSSKSESYYRFNTQTTAEVKNPFVVPGVKRMNIDPNLNPKYTFANFVEGDCNRLSRSAGFAVADSPGNNPFNPLYIYGDSGLGKTHIVQAIGHEVRMRHPELQVLYVPINKFQAQFQTAFKNGEIPDFVHFYQNVDVLIIDDIQELTGKTGTQNTFFNIFNHLHLSGKQIILTSDKPPVELKDIEQRLLTRFKWGFATHLNLPDYDTKAKIIRAKALKLNADISDDVVDFLATSIKANVREIEGALSSIIANASFLNRRITVSLAKEILKVYVRMEKREVSVDHILKVVCEHLNISVEMMCSSSRKRELVIARQMAMFLAKKHTSDSLMAIGSAFGGRNHATVLHACKCVSNLLETDQLFARQLSEIDKLILA